jgi:type II secretory pathway pseudopilin PulG
MGRGGKKAQQQRQQAQEKAQEELAQQQQARQKLEQERAQREHAREKLEEYVLGGGARASYPQVASQKQVVNSKCFSWLEGHNLDLAEINSVLSVPVNTSQEPLLAEVVTNTANATAEAVIAQETLPSPPISHESATIPPTPPPPAPDANPSYWKRIKKNYFDEERGTYPWRLEYREGRGHVAIANQDFRYGSLICSERPLIFTKGHPRPLFKPFQINEMKRKVSLLNEQDRQTFYSLPNVYTEQEYPKEVGIFVTCSFDDYLINDKDNTAQSFIFSAIASLQHSCAPNVKQTILVDEEDKRMVLFPLRDIVAGEELTISLIYLCQTKAKRQEELMKRYRFTCRCLACEYHPTFAYPAIKDVAFREEMDLNPEKNGVINSRETFERAMQWSDVYRLLGDEYDGVGTYHADRDQPMKALPFVTELIQGFQDPINKLWSIPYWPDLYLGKANIHMAMVMTCMMSRNSTIKASAEQHRDDMVDLTDDARQISQNISGPSSSDTKRMCAMVEANWHFEAMRF